MSGLRRLLITGATGKQGGALISALLTNPPLQPFEIVALTRNAKSARAQALARQPNVSVIEGDLNDCPAIFKKSPQPFHGVFSVQIPDDVVREEKQGKDLIDAAATNGVRHFVYTSADRGGTEKSDTTATAVAHFRSKFNIENHLKAVAAKSRGKMAWTIIRPVAFMDNLMPNFIGQGFVAMWRLNGLDSRMQLVSSRDVGILAAEVFKALEEYQGKAVSLATDELSPQEADAVFKHVIGTSMPSSSLLVGRLIKLVFREKLGTMFEWMRNEGFGADPGEFKTRYTDMQNFEQWLRYHSEFAPKVEEKGRASPS